MILVHCGPEEVVVTLSEDELEVIISALDFEFDCDEEQSAEDKLSNRGVRKMMVRKAKRARRLRRGVERARA